MAEIVTRRYMVTHVTRDCYCRALAPLAEAPAIPDLNMGDSYVLTLTEDSLLLDLFESILAEFFKTNGSKV